MIRAGMSPKDGPEIHRREIDHRALPVPQGAELPRRRQRRHRDSERRQEGRLGGRDRLRHLQARQAHQGRARARSRRRLDDHQRRLRPRPADPHRPAGPALGLAERQEPRQVRADGAVPRAARLRQGPHEAVHPPDASTARSSRTATPRSSSSRPRSRSNTPPTSSALETGDIFVCGTCGGVGQGTHTFINAGDVMETEVEGLGKMRNKFVAEKA